MRALIPAVALAGLIAVCPILHARQADTNTYTFEDERTGLSIQLPAAWERQKPAGTTIFTAVGRPYAGQPTSRPVLSCTALPLPTGQALGPSEFKQVLQQGIQSTVDLGGRGAAVSEPARIDIGGHEAYRISFSAPDDGPGSGQFVAMQKDGFVIVCAGLYDRASRDTVGRALRSISLRATPSSAAPLALLKGSYMKFGCGVVPAFDTATHVAERQKGTKREDAIATRAQVTFPMRASQYAVSESEYREYVARLIDDVYGHPALTAEDLGAYEVYKCDRVVNGRAFEPLDRYEMMLRGCPAGADRKPCREKLLLKLVADNR